MRSVAPVGLGQAALAGDPIAMDGGTRAHSGSAVQYRADIQGLRALAILPVVAYHADSSWMTGGFVGVDIFFVISGYLITGIVARELESGSFSIAGFYVRRIKRLFPALYTVLAVSLALGVILLTPKDLRELNRTTLATIFFASNFEFYRLADYFAGDAAFKPLLHTWSLAVEEQFYIFFPPALMALWKGAGRRYAIPILTAGLLASLAFSTWQTGSDASAAFYLLPSRAFELLIGALLALNAVPAIERRIAREFLSGIGIVLIVASIFSFDHDTRFPGINALIPCAGAAFIIQAGRGGQSAVARALGLPPLVLIGSLSYSLYLWHWPVIVFFRHSFLGNVDAGLTAAAVAIAGMASYLSWRFIERPVLERRMKGPRVLAAGIATMALFTGVVAVLYVGHGFPARFSPESLRLFESSNDFNTARPRCHGGENVPIPYERNCVYGTQGVAPDTVVWADSQGAELVAALGAHAESEGGAVMQITASACPPALDYAPAIRPHCAAHNGETFRRLVADKSIRSVFLVSYFALYPEKEWRQFSTGFEKAAEGLLAAGKRVVLVYPMPVFSYDPPSAIGLQVARGRDPAAYGITRADYARKNERAIRMLDGLRLKAGTASLDPAESFCDDSLCRPYSSTRGVLYFDRVHPSNAGARVLVEAMQAPVMRAGRNE